MNDLPQVPDFEINVKCKGNNKMNALIAGDKDAILSGFIYIIQALIKSGVENDELILSMVMGFIPEDEMSKNLINGEEGKEETFNKALNLMKKGLAKL